MNLVERTLRDILNHGRLTPIPTTILHVVKDVILMIENGTVRIEVGAVEIAESLPNPVATIENDLIIDELLKGDGLSLAALMRATGAKYANQKEKKIHKSVMDDALARYAQNDLIARKGVKWYMKGNGSAE
jgi:hypothetical protein